MLRDYLYYLVLLLVATLLAVLLFVLPDYLLTSSFSWSTALYLVAIGVGIFCIFAIATSWRIAAYIFLPLYFMLGAGLTFYRVAYAATLSPYLVGAFFHTNPNEATMLMSWPLLLSLLGGTAIGVALAYWRSRCHGGKLGLYTALVLLIFLPLYYLHFHLGLIQHYPFNVFFNTAEYVSMHSADEVEYTSLSYEATQPDDSLQIVLVIGESTRADHLALNGYSVPTTPLLSQRDNIVSFPHVYSPFTYTELALPYLLSPANVDCPDSLAQYESFLWYCREQGFYTSWMTNHDMGRLCDHYINTCDTVILSLDRYSRIGRRVDANMLPDLQTIHAAVREQHQRAVYVLHAMGSHWYYESYIPSDFQPFQPSLSSRLISENTTEQIINAYDNTVAYMDLVVDSVISMFEHENAVLFFLSDHGESLGENGIWLHGSDAAPEHNPAAFVWYSSLYASRHPEWVARVQSMEQDSLRTSILYQFVLEWIGLQQP